ncbi:single-strand-DNA-specific exonuclease [Crocosphaera subtropica ATCC 51142]|uniref:Single-stranded-DNA-specific exonuclease RecJ n=1 Tax=Crocosphaera subtropica (strain ATCC 51142 / BH68) TaxID=43989 RepID=B1WRC4_CROS5|nr:single-stranded-DNA-specific exonuclease RecJ [Crocosphaera subtropica]ACB51773.1 single-strand-DNA-specific exonuclease [Crocosphaera subtropica ATCC 51142]
MNTIHSQWEVLPIVSLPAWFLDIVNSYCTDSQGIYAAQLLWHRGIQTPEELQGFLDANYYYPLSPFEFGCEMKLATKRLEVAMNNQEKVTIWGDFDADGITATSVLWEGLGQFFIPHLQLNYYIPNRATESHGLNIPGIKKLADEGTKLIVTCDTGSTNIEEINYANSLEIDIIVTDHHTLPNDRPNVVSIINPRYFYEDHPLFSLSGVAVAYKLVEALYLSFPEIPESPLENLLDLVAIGLIADLVELKGDCRYLAQQGLKKLQQQLKNTTRPGVAHLLNLCKRGGDRPTDISFGIGPRINAISRIQGDAHFAVELLTSKDEERCKELAFETELANTRRKSLQKDIKKNVEKKLQMLDLSTTQVIVLEDPQWQSGVLGLVAGQIAQEYGRPTILLTTAETEKMSESDLKLARGSARSVYNIDLYKLVASQRDLLHKFGGHPFAAGLSLPVENLSLFRENINRKLRQEIIDLNTLSSTIQADLVVTVSQLGQSLFRELKLLEPYGMGNPVPRLLIQNCWFEALGNQNIRDAKNNKIKYIKTKFDIYDNSVDEGFPGIWWEHYQEELPQGKNKRCDAIVELDYNTYGKGRYEVRLIEVRESLKTHEYQSIKTNQITLIDYRNQDQVNESYLELEQLSSCPVSWDELYKKYQTSINNQHDLALNYSYDEQFNPSEMIKQLIGIAKYLNRTQKTITKEQLKEKLLLSDRTLNLALEFLEKIGFLIIQEDQTIQIETTTHLSQEYYLSQKKLIDTLQEEHFKRKYFTQVPVETLQQLLVSESLNY